MRADTPHELCPMLFPAALLHWFTGRRVAASDFIKNIP